MLIGSFEYILDIDVQAAKLVRAKNRAGATLKTQGYRGDVEAAETTAILDVLGPLSLGSRAIRQDPAWTTSVQSARFSREGRGIGTFPHLGSSTPLQIVGSDDRIMVDTAPTDATGQPGVDRTAWPFRTALALVYFDPGTGYANPAGSAQLVGYRTAMTAAHVIYDRAAGTYYAKKPGITGVVTKENFLGENISQTWQYGPTSCFVPIIDSGWYLYGSRDYDFGIIDFTDDDAGCYEEPGRWVGYMPMAIGSAEDYLRNASRITGYDVFDQHPVNPRFPYSSPTGMTRSGGAFSVALLGSNPTRLVYNHDTESGASGSGVLQNLFWYAYGDPTLYYVGDHAGPLSGSTTLNEARRFDWYVWDFLQRSSHEY